MDFHKTSVRCQYNMKADSRPTDSKTLQKIFSMSKTYYIFEYFSRTLIFKTAFDNMLSK